ncbi:uncharacterized protein LOC134205143 [Armigeres subalbatus]|uniref:uncharacterized protein LOC134205143 n=1 Tax=Armigeres subalbatus TaxID=124917 RepID=UPI002ED53248
MDDPQRSTIGDSLIREYSSETFCRLCFSQIHELHRVFPPNGQPNKLLVRKIQYCTNIDITFGKDSNACVCTKCIALVEEFFRFKQLCSSNEQWLEIYDGGHHVASGRRSSSVALCRTPPNPSLMESLNTNDSLITIDLENVASAELLNNDTLQTNSTMDETALKLEDSVEETRITNNDVNEVTSSGRCMRARKPTTRIIQEVPLNSMAKIPIKIESDLDATSASETSECREFSPVIEGGANGSRGFTLVRGSKSRSNRLYLVYQTYRYSNRNNDGKIWHCTRRGNICCKAVVMLEKDRIIELNNHHHNHPPPFMPQRKKITNDAPSTNSKNNVKISLVLKKENESRLRRSNTRFGNQTAKTSEGNKWFIKANRKTVDGFTYTFCGLRKDGIIRLKCISKGCAGRIYMYSNGDLFSTNKEHNHAPHNSD